MTDAPKLTASGHTRIPDVFWLEEVIGADGFSRMVGADLPKNDAARNQGRRYILDTPEALSEAPEVEALIAEAVERATRVKPLVWEPVGPDELLSDDYCIKIDGFTLRLWHRDLLIASSRDIDGIARLQSIADKHHDQRIRAAIGGNDE
jgi:hypothetical protein